MIDRAKLIKWLRGMYCSIREDAADMLEADAARIAELEAALAPFAETKWRFDDDGFPAAVVASMDIVHRARNVLGKDKADD